MFEKLLSGKWIGTVSIGNIICSFAGISVRADGVAYMEKQKEIHGQDYLQPTAVPMITSAYNLPSKYIIHVVGPIVSPRILSVSIRNSWQSAIGAASTWQKQRRFSHHSILLQWASKSSPSKTTTASK